MITCTFWAINCSVTKCSTAECRVGVAVYPVSVVEPGYEARVGEEPKGIYMANNTTNLITCIQ